MAGKTLIGGTAYKMKGGKTLIGGTAYKIKAGKTKVGGTAYDIKFVNIPRDGLLFEYLLHDNLADTSGNNVGSLVLASNSYLTTDYSDNALRMTMQANRSLNRVLMMPAAWSVPQSYVWTWSFWFKTNMTNNYLFSVDYSTQFRIDQTEIWDGYPGDSDNDPVTYWYKSSISPSLAVNAWHHVVIVANNNSMVGFVDGAKHTFSLSTKTKILGDTNKALLDLLSISNTGRQTYYKQLRGYSRALTDAECLQLYAEG